MLVLFGRYKEAARLIAGAALLVIGIVLHMVLVIVAGGALLAWAPSGCWPPGGRGDRDHRRPAD